MVAGRRSFQAILERGTNGLGWTIARVPFDPRLTWPEMVRLRVTGTITGPRSTANLRTSLFPEPEGLRQQGFFLLITRAVQTATGLVAGDIAALELDADLEDRPAKVPEALNVLLDEAEGLRAWYDGLTEYARREIGKWIDAAKSEEGRVRRAEQMGERLLNTMEAEIELPPLLCQAFVHRPAAVSGWKHMTPTQRRGELMAVFSYQSPEARARRIAKLVTAAEQRGRNRADP